MKKIMIIQLVILLCCSISSQTFAARQKKVSLQIRKAELRTSPSFLGNVVTSVHYGDRLTVLQKKGKWTKVSNPKGSKSGWIHSSALIKKRIKLVAGEKDADLAVSSGEMALAGKGFNSDVEAKFKAKNSDIDFSRIDKMEKIKISSKEIRTFLKNGAINPPKGGLQ